MSSGGGVLRLIAAVSLLCSCAAPRPGTRAPRRALPTRTLDLALVVTDDTGDSVKRVKDQSEGVMAGASPAGRSYSGRPFESVAAALRGRFRSVTRVQDFEKGLDSGADLVAFLDVHADYRSPSVGRAAGCAVLTNFLALATWGYALHRCAPHRVRVDVSIAFLDRGRNQLDLIRVSVGRASREAGATLSVLVPRAAEEVRVRLLDALASSSRLSELGAAKREFERPLIEKLAGKAISTEDVGELRFPVDRPAYQAPAKPDHHALVIGVEKYKHAPPARYAERDAGAVRRHLAALGVPKENLVHLAGERATGAAIAARLEALLARKGPVSRLYLYFAGHGASDSETGRAFLLPWDGDPDALKRTAYSLKSLYATLNALKAEEIIVILDAGFSGKGVRSVRGKDEPPPVDAQWKEDAVGRAVVLAACAPDEDAGLDEPTEHGLFTRHILESLNRWKGQPTAWGVYVESFAGVEAAAKALSVKQTPQIVPARPGERGKIRFRGLRE